MKKIVTVILPATMALSSIFFVNPKPSVAQSSTDLTNSVLVNEPTSYEALKTMEALPGSSQSVLSAPVVGTPDNVPISDGPVYTWDYVGRTYGNNIFETKSYSFLSNAVVAGLSATVIGRISSAFWGGVTGYILGGISISSGKYYWWTVDKWIDNDATYYYFKYDVKVYSNSSRTNLVDSYFTVERATRIK